MDKVIYDSRLKIHKEPFGAVSTTDTVRFTIYVSKDVNPKEVFFVYRQDQEDLPIYICMNKDAEYDGHYAYSCSLLFDNANLYFYRFEIKTEDETLHIGLKDGKAQIEDWLAEWQLTVYDANFKTPDWVPGGIMYQIFPDRFCKSDKFVPLKSANERKIHKNWYDIPDFIYDNPDYKSNDYFCGNIDGIIEKLNYIKSLGVTIIYLNPVFESPEYHRYSTANYFNIDPYFGTNEKFAELVKKCHEIGIKVIIDGVFSHTGADSIYFNKYNHYDSVGAYNSKDSKYYSWYNFVDYPDKYECWWNFENLPNVNENNEEYSNYITGKDGVIQYWQNIGCDGWRLDVADELPDEFLDKLYTRAKETDKDSFIIGEVWEDATNKFAYGVRRRYLLGGQMDSVMNYPWRTAIIDFVNNGDSNLFNERIMSIMENYPPHVLQCLMNSISTHDTIRAITLFGANLDVPPKEQGGYIMSKEEYNNGKSKLFCATFLQFTLPGIPCIYYGDEVGLQGFKDPYCRMAYPYGREDVEILDFYRKLAKIRTMQKTDFTKPLNPIFIEDGLYSFSRGNLQIAINLSDSEKSINVSKDEMIFSHNKCEFKDNILTLAPISMAILK